MAISKIYIYTKWAASISLYTPKMKILTKIVCLINHLGHLEWKDLKIMHYKVHFFQFGVDQEISFRKQQSGFRNQSIRRNLFKHIRKECSQWDHWKLPGFFLWKPKIIQIEQREYMHLEHLPFFHIYCIAQGTGGSCDFLHLTYRCTG